MNALAQNLVGAAIEDAIWQLETRAMIRAYLEYEWQYEHLADAIDPLQAFAEQSGLVAAIGQDEVQRLIAKPFERFRAIVAAEIEAEQHVAADLPSDYAQRLVRDWELADPRDRWRHTGELPPPPEKGPKRLNFPIISESCRCPAPQSTKDAFKYVVALGDADHLRRWLRDHAAVAHVLVNEVA
ncbi:hypothetical protein CO683_14780 [Bradyrhizobium ottawaense]|uniref:hypothetical protein n=1 Tax=Bradyrhizobium ottawaense TaxID=931866 RepID=UPI000BE90196|nr:hypothetical protein [Bradyrhizobium ottawaense]PDT69226.1 hypothetical protein CO683_14780 [Bradyrhizobium ottawaense]